MKLEIVKTEEEPENLARSSLYRPTALALKDAREAAKSLGRSEIRYLVDYYYTAQEHRLAACNQERALASRDEPNSVIAWLANVESSVEQQIKTLLAAWVKQEDSGVAAWLTSIVGIGPVICAGLMAHIDITKSTNVSQLWSFAGQNPNAVWEKGKKRPWNAKLKVLCWKAGESFVKTCNHPNSFYGPIYAKRKELEIARNEQGLFADQAAAKLSRFRIGKDTEAYKWYSEGKLPPGHIHARAKKYAVSIFLSHLWVVMYEIYYGEEAPKPWIIAHGGHTDYIPPPDYTPPPSWDRGF